jgi:hypothetical protein
MLLDPDVLVGHAASIFTLMGKAILENAERNLM